VKTKAFYAQIAQSLRITRKSHRESGFLIKIDGSLGALVAPDPKDYITDLELAKIWNDEYNSSKAKGLTDAQAKFFADAKVSAYLDSKGANKLNFILDHNGTQVGTYHSHPPGSNVTPSPADRKTIESIGFWLAKAGKLDIQPWGFLAMPSKGSCAAVAELISYTEVEGSGKATGIFIKYDK
jgi:proteasome lid subunit RPN8/RPN11